MPKRKKVGFCLTGSFCTFKEILPQIELLQKHYEIYPIMSFNASNTDTRFGTSEEFKSKIKKITKKNVMNSIAEVEPIGPKKILDLLVICPCTGNSLAKMANGISDTPVTLSFKSHLRNKRPVVLAISTNDGLSASAKNIGILLEKKHIYFVPFSQDDYKEKPTSLVANFTLLKSTIEMAFNNIQVQPLLDCGCKNS